MSRSRLAGMHVIPWILATSGCAAAPFLYSSSPKPLPPNRLMAIARTFERQGDEAHARELYQKILAADPTSVVAKEHLESLIASSQSPATNRNRRSPTPKARREPTKSQPLSAERSLESLASAKSGSSDDRGVVPAGVSSQTRQVSAEVFEVPLPVAPVERESGAVTAAATDIPPSPVTTQAQEVAEIQWERPIRVSSNAATVDREDFNTNRSNSQAAQNIQATAPEAKVSGPELRAGENEVIAAAEMAQQLSPGSRGLPPELQPLFGPFKSEMLDYAREHHAEIQTGLVRMVTDPAEIQLRRSRANFILGRIGPSASDAVRALRCTMRATPDTSFRIEVAETILLIEPGDDDAIQALLTLLRDGDADTKSYAAFALRASCSPKTAYVVDELLNATATNDCRLRRMLLLALGEFGSTADKAIPVLTAALNDPDPATRIIAASSMKMISPQPAVDPVAYQISRTPGADAR